MPTDPFLRTQQERGRMLRDSLHSIDQHRVDQHRVDAGSAAQPRSRFVAGPSWILVAAMLALATGLTTGCTSLWPGRKDDAHDKQLNDLMKVPEPPDLIREAGAPRGLNEIAIEGVAAVNALPGTGGPADPSIYRQQLIEEMKTNDVKDPNLFLELPETALVRVQAIIPAGARRGDEIDLQIMTPPRSKVTNLHSGWLLDTRLRQQIRIQNSVRQSEVMAVGIGPVLTRADYEGGAEETHRIEGRVIGGGRVQNDRTLGFVLRPEFQHVKMSAGLAGAINHRFYFFDGTTRRGIAKPTEDDYIEIDVHPRYRGQETRLMAIIGAIGVKPESSATQARLIELSKRLKEPATAADAANQLEALGESAIPTLTESLTTSNPELKYYAAEALAYLDRVESIAPLEESIRNVAAFRHPGLAALQGMESHEALAALKRLMDQSSLETRYGAFCAIRRRSDGKTSLGGKSIGTALKLYRIASQGSPAVVISTRETPEIVLFGNVSSLEIPDFLFGSDGLLLKPDTSQSGQIHISRFQAGQADKRVTVSGGVDAVIAGIVAVGGGYGDVVNTLRNAKAAGFLRDQLALDPLPKSLRTYHRDDSPSLEDTPIPAGERSPQSQDF